MEDPIDLWCEENDLGGFRKVLMLVGGLSLFVCLISFLLALPVVVDHSAQRVSIENPYQDFNNAWLVCFVALLVAVLMWALTLARIMRAYLAGVVIVLCVTALFFLGKQAYKLDHWHRQKVLFVQELEQRCHRFIKPHLKYSGFYEKAADADSTAAPLRGLYCVMRPIGRDRLDKMTQNGFGYILDKCPNAPLPISSIKYLVFYDFQRASSQSYAVTRSTSHFWTENMNLGESTFTTYTINVTVFDLQNLSIVRTISFAPPPLQESYYNDSPVTSSINDYETWLDKNIIY